MKITIDTNLVRVDYLDVTLDLETGLFKPYRKPGDKPVYVSALSNHPPQILKNIPKGIERRLSDNSANEEVFKEAIPVYKAELERSGFTHKLEYRPGSDQTNTRKKGNRKRKITWFNPPYSKNVQTNIGKQFLNLLDKNFPANHPLRKIINRNTVKISYRCMPNMKTKISSHNFKVLKGAEEIQPIYGCNCTNAIGPCPLNGNCLVNSLVYKAEVTDQNQNSTTYTGLTRNTFKQRFYGHRHSFKNRSSEHSTTLSSHIWDLKDKNEDYNVNWSVIGRASDFNPITRKCRLCIKEKFHIIFQPEGAKLNERSELFSTCRHRKRQLLANT